MTTNCRAVSSVDSTVGASWTRRRMRRSLILLDEIDALQHTRRVKS
jgi:hypothetical protein